MTIEETGEAKRLPPFTLPEGPVERACRLICYVALITMLVVIGVDILTRSLFKYSLEISDEIAGYMLVVISFMSLPVCQINGSFHEVELVQARLSLRLQMLTRAVFELMSVAVVLLLLWKYVDLVARSWRFDERAPTYLETALWIPRLAMVVGMAALSVSLMRTFLARLHYLGGATPRVGPHDGR